MLWKVFDPSKETQLELLSAEDLDQQIALLELEQRQWVKEFIHSIHNVASNDPKRWTNCSNVCRILTWEPYGQCFGGV